MSIIIKDLVKRYNNKLVLDYFNLQMQEEEILGLLGSDGSGKSTVIGCLLGLLAYDKGEITIFGQELDKKSLEYRRKIGIVPQNITIFDGLTIYENVDFFCALYIKNKAERKKCVEEALVDCDLERVSRMYPKNLDFGTLRRVNFACGISHKPKLLILDEATLGADSVSRENILLNIRKRNADKTTVFYASKNMEELAGLCDRIAIMDKGKVIITATVEELKTFISVGEKIVIEVFRLSSREEEELSKLHGIMFTNYTGNELVIKSEKGINNLANILHYLENHKIPFGKVYSEVPVLKEAFWEITGREL